MAGVHLCIGSLLSDRAMIHLEYSQGQDRSGLIPLRSRNFVIFSEKPRRSGRVEGGWAAQMPSGGVRMPEGAAGSDPVSHELLDLLDVRKAAAFFPRPDHFIVNAHLEHPSRSIRGEHHGADLLGEGCQQFLGHPIGPQTPAA
jgi:hypothetical protein